jgi:hypothetical protein
LATLKGWPYYFPIVGARNAHQVTENLACLDFELSAEHLKRLNEVSQIDLGFPHAFLEREDVRKLILGKAASLIENHRHKAESRVTKLPIPDVKN